MAVIFYAIILNLGKIAEHKTLTTVAAIGAASYMASAEASFAEQLYQVQLGGPAKAKDDATVCAWTGVFTALIAIAIIIAALFVPVILAALPGWAIALAIILAVASVGIQLMVIQPGLTALWNKITQTYPIADQFLEHGISLALSGAVNDPVTIDDKFDMDLDGMFGSADAVSRYGYYYTRRLSAPAGMDPKVINDFLIALQRFIYGYSDKLQPPATPETRADRTWALLDPVECPSDHPCCKPNPPPECNPCCVPCCKEKCAGGCVQEDHYCKPICTQLGMGTQPLRPLSCSTAEPLPECNIGNPYGSTYPYIYNPLYEDSSPGSFVSFLETLGKDDETKNFRTKTKGDFSVAQESDPGNALYDPPIKMFRLNDAQPGNSVGKVYPFLYKIRDWGLDQRSPLSAPLPARPEFIREVPPAVSLTDLLPKIPEHCIWYSLGSDPLTNSASGVVCPPLTDIDMPLGFPAKPGDPNKADQLDLPGPALKYNGQLWVDIDNQNDCGPGALDPNAKDRCVSDKVATIDKILASDTAGPPNIECASWDSALDNQPPALSGVAGTPSPGMVLGRWKKGADRYCAYTPADFIDRPRLAWEKWPYYSFCPKHGLCMSDPDKPEDNLIECECDEPKTELIKDPPKPATEWPDDLFDSFYRLNEFVTWSRKLLSMDLLTLTASFKEWYPEFATWFEPQGVNAAGESILGQDVAYMQQPFDGLVRQMRNNLKRWSDTLDEWLNKTSFQGENCYDVWCIPDQTGGAKTHYVGTPPGACPGVKLTEAVSFSDALGGVVGNPHSIAACLNYNANDKGGNSAKFKSCFDACNEDNCENLPRSLLYPDVNFDTNEFVVPHTKPSGGSPSDVERFDKCLDDCHYDPTGGAGDWAFCSTLPSGPTPWHGPAKTTILKYPTDGHIPPPLAGGGPTSAPQWDIVKSLENCRVGTDDNSCQGQYTKCDETVGNPCNNCKSSCESLVAGCDACVSGCTSACNPTTCEQACRRNKCLGICSTMSCDVVYTTCEGSITGQDGLTCDNACAGGTIAAPQACECNLQKCKNVARCNTLIGTYDCDDFAMLNDCHCGTDYNSCVAASEAAETTCRSACPDVSTVRGIEMDGPVVVPYIRTPDPDCLDACREANKTQIGVCEATFVNCRDVVDGGKPTPLEPGIYPGCPPCDGAAPPIGGISGAQCAANTGPQCGFQTLIDKYWGTCRHWNDANEFYKKVWASWIMAQGECVEESRPADGSTNYRWALDPLLFGSYQEAKNQVSKFEYRRKFLSTVENEAKGVKTFFDDGVKNFDTILAEAAKLTLARYNLDQGINVTLPNQAIYAWRSPMLPGKVYAPWHVVLAEAYVPGRCSGQCGRNTNLEPDLPSIKSYTHAWGTRRCYALGDYFGKAAGSGPDAGGDCKEKGDFDDIPRCFKGGTVKAKVIRWDEDKDLLLSFVNGIEIWKYRFHNPKGGTTPFITPVDGRIMKDVNVCGTKPPNPKALISPDAPDAFMINKREDNEACWDELNGLLRRGVMSRACAEYFFHTDPHNEKLNGFNLKFKECVNTF